MLGLEALTRWLHWLFLPTSQAKRKALLAAQESHEADKAAAAERERALTEALARVELACAAAAAREDELQRELDDAAGAVARERASTAGVLAELQEGNAERLERQRASAEKAATAERLSLLQVGRSQCNHSMGACQSGSGSGSGSGSSLFAPADQG